MDQLSSTHPAPPDAANQFFDPRLGYQDLSTPSPRPPQDDFYRYRIDGFDIIQEMQHQLRGELFDESKGKYLKAFDRWINESGISKITHIVYSLGINKNTFLGNLSRDQVLFKCRMLKIKLSRLVMRKYVEYEIKREMWDLLVMTVVNTVHSGLSRSENGREGTQLSTAAQRIDQYHHMEGQKSEGLLAKFMQKKQ